MQTSAERIAALFAGNDGQHGTHGVPDLDPNGRKWSIKRTAKTLKGGPTLAMWQQHLDGKRPLGVVPIRKDSKCCWGSIDIDEYDIDLINIVKRVKQLGLPLVPGRSKSGGLHLYLFLCEPVDAMLVQNVLRDMAASLGFAGSEIFPKQTTILVEQGDMGNWMVMPYYGDDFGGKLRMQRGLKETGAEMTIGEFLTVSEKARVSLADVQKMMDDRPEPEKKGKKKKEAGPFSDGPPCLQKLAVTGFPDGGRNNALFHIGVFHKKANPSDWQKRVEDDNQNFMKPPLPSEEVDSLIKQLQKKDYEYKCKDQPMVRHCESTKCMGRKFGVGDGGAYPEIHALSRLMSDPVLWFVQIPGSERRMVMSTEDLQNYQKFHKHCMAHTKVCYRLIGQQMWFIILGEAMKKADDIAAPSDISVAQVFKEQMEEYLTNRMRGKAKEDLLRGAPWEDEEAGLHYFRLAPFMQFLQREGMKGVERGMVMYRIRKLGGGCLDKGMEIKGQRRSVWWIPVKSLEPAPELDVPDLPEEML